MSKSQHKKRQTHPKHQNRPTQAKNQSTQTKKQSTQPKERGWVLMLAIIYVILHGFVLLGVVVGENGLANLSDHTLIIASTIAAGIVGIVAGIMLWRWKQLGLTLYLIATLGEIIAGLLITGSMLFIFSAIIPFAIVGYIVRMHWSKFD
ncbi:MAG: hypothetical protein KDE48_14540 [Anaerolineales bacterium]|nr:hypothetical protein [Anaerolineales bacterium]